MYTKDDRPTGNGTASGRSVAKWRVSAGVASLAFLVLASPASIALADSQSDSPDVDSGRGRIELRLLGGANYGPGRERFDSKTASSIGLEGSYGLNRHLKGILDFRYSRLGRYTSAA